MPREELECISMILFLLYSVADRSDGYPILYPQGYGAGEFLCRFCQPRIRYSGHATRWALIRIDGGKLPALIMR